MRRVVVVGTSGSGKSTLARQLAKVLSVPHIELDELYWGPNWTVTSTPRFRDKVIAAMDASPGGWIMCGNYRIARDLIYPRADTIVWLDYPMREVFTRCLLRTLRRWWNDEQLWNGNHERLWTKFCSKDSLLLWVINTWRLRRREYPKMFGSDECRHMRVLRFRTPGATERWLRRISP